MAVSFPTASPISELLSNHIKTRNGVGDLLRIAGAYSFQLPFLVCV